jgi:intein-encoded DNA endonuclease-like protein
MAKPIRTDHSLRLEAFDLLQEMKVKQESRKQIVTKLHKQFKIPLATLYTWYAGTYRPYGWRGDLSYNSELLYVLGALLGDGCLYRWKITKYYLILVGDHSFTTKYAKRLSKCVTREVRPYINRSKGIWFVRTNNNLLASLFENLRLNPEKIHSLGQKISCSCLPFVEGFFDAEGCVKIIKEKARKTPKICLDIANTNFAILEQVRRILEEELGIITRYSVQEAFVGADGCLRKKVYHLRIYTKEFIKRYFEHMSTIKLTPEKQILLQNWLANGK